MADLITGFLPIVVFVALFLVMGTKQARRYKEHIDQVTSINQEILDMNRRSVQILEDIKAVLQDRKT